MNVSQCSQRRKSLLYDLLRAAYQEHQSSPDAYYQLLKPVIGESHCNERAGLAAAEPAPMQSPRRQTPPHAPQASKAEQGLDAATHLTSRGPGL